MEYTGGWISGVVSELHTSGLPLNARSNAYENVRLVKRGPGLFLGFSAYSSKASSQFIQVFDKAEAPASGDVPDALFTVLTIANLAVSWIFPGRFHKYGIWIANSSTGPTYTAGSADTFFDAQFI